MSGCNCRDCAEGRAARHALRWGGEDWETDYDEPVRYVKPARSNWNGKRKRPCKKSKTKEVCDFSVRINKSWYDVMTCSRCGKHGTYIWRTTFTMENDTG